MHMHLETFQVVNRQAFDVDRYYDRLGRRIWRPVGTRAQAPSSSDYLIGPAGDARPRGDGLQGHRQGLSGLRDAGCARSSPCRGRPRLDYDPTTRSYGTWVYHCHILEHEENDMMRPFEVVK